jgi:NAD(P)-dependent dehydrogenase (short-subunit alcohol dehydrogenase family)
MDVSRQTALVTGATARIGRQTAMEMARRGISVVIVGRDPERGTAVADDLARESGNNNVAFEQADAASQQSVRDLAARVAERHERLDILVNNVAGLYVRRTLTVDGVEATLAVTHLSSYLMTRLLLPALGRSEGPGW